METPYSAGFGIQTFYRLPADDKGVIFDQSSVGLAPGGRQFPLTSIQQSNYYAPWKKDSSLRLVSRT